jgi:PAS domain S-box-containing protein
MNDMARYGAIADAASTPVAMDSGASVLLVDDQPARLLSYEAVLASLNVHCVRALSGTEALERLLKQQFAVIVLDVNMPGMDGFELARLIREHPRLERTPIIFVTGVNVTDLDRLKGYEVGAIDYIPIPIVPEILRSKVAILVELHQRRSELQNLNEALKEARDQLDVDHARAMADARAQFQERLLLAKRAARLGIYDWDIRNGKLDWDERTRELWGLGLDAPVSYEIFAAALHPEDRVEMQRAVDQALDPSGDGHYSAAYRVNGADGVVRWVEAVGRVSFEGGRPVRLIGTVHDVTDRKETEAKLRAADRLKDEFIAMLAHELRNPVAPIRNAAEILAHMLAQDERALAFVNMIKRQTVQLARLLDDLLDVARFTQGRIELRLEVFTLDSCIEAAVETATPVIHEKGLSLTVSNSPEPLCVRGDKVRLTQSVANLLTNAAKYTLAGGEIRVTTRSEGTDIIIAVTDTGIGIEPQLLPRIFDFFVQGERSLDRAQGGLGIGLSVCKRLVEMHGGQVTASSPGPQLGSTFSIRLPRAPSELPDR